MASTTKMVWPLPDISSTGWGSTLIDGSGTFDSVDEDFYNLSAAVVSGSGGGSGSPDYQYYYGVDLDSSTYVYAGYKIVSGDAWRIKRVNRGTYEILWAWGDVSGSASWTNHVNLSYSVL